MRRPLVGVALCFMGGILIGEYCALPTGGPWGAVAGFLLCSLLSLVLPTTTWVRDLCVLLLVVAAGTVHKAAGRRPPPSDDIRLVASEAPAIAKLRGVIDTPPEIRRQERSPHELPGQDSPRVSTGFALAANAIRIGQGWEAVTGNVSVRIYAEAPDLRYGDAIEISAAIRRPSPPSNPGEFDYEKFLARQDTYVLAGAPFAENCRILSRGHGSCLKRWGYAIRQAADSLILRHASQRGQSILLCLLLGRRAAVSGDLEEAFVRTGTAHVLAISGLHLMMLAGSLWWLLCATCMDRRVNAILVILFVAGYVLLTGMRAPVLRAGIITALMCVGEIWEKPRDTINSLAVAALVILAYDPNQLFSAGFQLSFVAVLGIVCFHRPIHEFLFEPPGLADRLAPLSEQGLLRQMSGAYARGTICASLSAMLAAGPIVAWYFHVFTPMAVAFNLLIFPLVWAIIGSGVLAIFIGPFSDRLAGAFLQMSDLLTFLFEWTVRICGKIYFAYIYLPSPSPAWLIACYLILILAACRRYLPLKRVHYWILAASLFIVPACAYALAPQAQEIRVTCMDTGHGASILIEFPNGRNLLYDAGAWGPSDVGKRVIAPALWSRGIRHIDALVLSHPHSDHYSGVLSVRDRFRVDHLLTAGHFADSPATRMIVDALTSWGVRAETIAAGDRIAGYSDCAVDVLHPPEGSAAERMEPNDRSCVLRVRWGGFSLLLTADIERDGARVLLRNSPDVRAAVVQIPHHGGVSREVARLLKAASPEIAFVNLGSGEAPSQTVFATLPRTRIYDTFHCGAITITAEPNGHVSVKTFLRGAS